MSKRRDDVYFISAGEYSGDLLAADLVHWFTNLIPDFQAIGLAGEAMKRAGVVPIVDQSDFNFMGISDVVKHLGMLRLKETYLLKAIDARAPKFAVLVDFPGLHFRLAEQLYLRNIPVIQYVAPKLWAWGANRIKQLREHFDLVLGILPFEAEYFRDHGVNYHYVGTPQKDRIKKIEVSRAKLGISHQGPIVSLLPGSRFSEITKILPRLLKIKSQIAAQLKNATFVVPVARSVGLEMVAKILCKETELRPSSVLSGASEIDGVHFIEGMSLELMAISDVAVLASGTATLECSLLETPMVVVYVMDALTYEVAHEAVQLPHVSLVNLLAGKEVVPEYIQNFSDREVGNHAVSLVTNEVMRNNMVRDLRDVANLLTNNASQHAAEHVVEFVSSRRKRRDY